MNQSYDDLEDYDDCDISSGCVAFVIAAMIGAAAMIGFIIGRSW